MFDSISWGELTIVVGIGLFVIGKKDLPKAANLLGTQVGRVVGLLQGARARADQFASHNELRQLQRELQSGLRELDMVKSELAVSMSGSRNMSGGMMSGGGATRMNLQSSPSSIPSSSMAAAAGKVTSTGSAAGEATSIPESMSTSPLHLQAQSQPSLLQLPPASQSIAAVAEEEWMKQGISFKSRAELGAGLKSYDASASGSILLANMIQQSLIFDQYDRAITEQDLVLQSKINRVKETMEKKTNSAIASDEEKETTPMKEKER